MHFAPAQPSRSGAGQDLVRTYDIMLSSGKYTFRNYVLFRLWPTSRIFKWWWERPSRKGVEGINLPLPGRSRTLSLCRSSAPGFQTQSVIAQAISDGACDAVSMARPLLANPDLPLFFAQGLDEAPKPCTYCNKCLVNFIENPLGCYEESRYSSREEMLRTIMSAYEPAPAP